MTTRYVLRLFVLGIIMAMVVLLLAIPYNLKFELSTIRQRISGFYRVIVGEKATTVDQSCCLTVFRIILQLDLSF